MTDFVREMKFNYFWMNNSELTSACNDFKNSYEVAESSVIDDFLLHRINTSGWWPDLKEIGEL